MRLPLLTLVLALSIGLGCRSGSPTSPDGGAEVLAFTVSPIAQSAIEFITPLGNLNPPDHTLPTDHIYFYHHLSHQAAPPFEVVAPAAGTVSSILSRNSDQKVNVTVTSSISYYLDHVLLDDSVTLNSKITAGQRLGVTSGAAYAIDLGVVNEGISLGFINPARYASDSVHADAPLKSFVEPLKSSLYALVQRTGSDKDGQVCFDQAGHLAGGWFLDGLPVAQSADFTSGPMELAFVRDVHDPSVVRISIGGTLAMTGIFGVDASDPDPASITPASGVVTYQLSPSAFGAPSGILLVQMTAPDTIRVEAFPGATAGSVSFTASSRTYVR